jgi:ABC-type sulfate transport system permease component
LLAGILSRLTYANVMASMAVFIAVGLGTAWALERNSVKSKHIVNGQVQEPDLAANSV